MYSNTFIFIYLYIHIYTDLFLFTNTVRKYHYFLHFTGELTHIDTSNKDIHFVMYTVEV